jgi:molybdopterin converting factor small subunit
MKVSVKLIATLRDKLPEGATDNACEIDVPTGSVVEDVLSRFDIANDGTNVILVNGRVPDPGQELAEGDVVCAFPAMAGG